MYKRCKSATFIRERENNHGYKKPRINITLVEPSAADKDLTDLLIQACRIMRTPVLDHVIITEHSYLGFKETGLLERLEASLKYVPPYELERQYHEEMEATIQAVEQTSRKKIRESLKRGKEIGEKESRQLGKEEGIELDKAAGRSAGDAN